MAIRDDEIHFGETSRHLNQLRLPFLTSFTGGHPNVLESIACGTTLLAIPKGAIPDIFIDCETWFIMEDNLPEFISGR
jgi:glycosyltransferase involved in cell wall biosynthesis